MSADNGIYIAKFPEGYRVAHAQAIENVDYYAPGTIEARDVLKSYFGRSPVYATKEEAIIAAHKMEEEVLNDPLGILEYGVGFIGEYESFL